MRGVSAGDLTRVADSGSPECRSPRELALAIERGLDAASCSSVAAAGELGEGACGRCLRCLVVPSVSCALGDDVKRMSFRMSFRLLQSFAAVGEHSFAS